MPSEDVKVSPASSASARIIAAGILIAFCYWASSVLVTLLVAVLLAYFLDPVVNWLESLHVPRGLGALVVVLLTILALFVAGYALVVRVDQFGADWDSYRKPLRAAVDAISKKAASVEAHVSEIAPTPKAGKESQVVAVTETHMVRDAILSKLSSLSEILLSAAFVPFLVFFMLAAKRQVWHATMQLFPSTQRTAVKQTLSDVSQVLRSYVVGTALVGVVLVGVSWAVFWAFGLDFPFLVALVSGLCNLIPYFGVILSWLPPLLVGLRKFHSAGRFLEIFLILTIIHLFAANFLVPSLVGWRVRLNALAITLALMFWGFMWGGMGLILAIPITAVIKVICDHVESLQPVGRWLSA